jgi:hypothetical protein
MELWDSFVSLKQARVRPSSQILSTFSKAVYRATILNTSC